jgi:hypothetical protein
MKIVDAKTLQVKLAKRLRWQMHAHQLEKQHKNLVYILPLLRKWQAERLRRSFERFLDNQSTRPAAEFFLTDLYSDADFMKRDIEAAKILPKMVRILPSNLLYAAIDAIELAVLSHALDIRMALYLHELMDKNDVINENLYQKAYLQVGFPRLRLRQIRLIKDVGIRLDSVVQKHGIAKLLAASRLPARLLGLGHLQGFLERGFTAFNHLGGANYFLNEIFTQELIISKRLFAGADMPFEPPFN